ncbi:hypothetical protein M2345_000163 [Sphingobium sp. B8D3D]|nr:hypothetical protein [Sphingobium sp. B8D3D]MCW2413903.1 hypothetical protein [Sphingobium sp. B8D3A]
MQERCVPVLEDERVALRNRALHRYFARRVPVGEVKHLMEDVLASTTVRKSPQIETLQGAHSQANSCFRPL